MSRKLFDRLFKFIIHFINRRFFRFLRCRSNRTLVHSQFTKINTVICLIRNMLRNNIFGSIDRICYCFHTFFFRYKILCFFFNRLDCHLKHNDICQRFQSFFLRNDRTGTTFRSEWTIKILYYDQCLCIKDLFLQLCRQFSLLFNTSKYLILFFFQITKIGQSFMKSTKLFII